MRRLFAVLAPALLLLALVAGCGSSGSSSGSTSTSGSGSGGSSTSSGTSDTTHASAAATVATASGGSLGTILVDGSGRALYLFVPDRGPQSTCYGGCAAAWPPLTTSGKPIAGNGATASMLSTSKRRDGTLQVDYAGHPLYYYAGDASAGDTNGQGINGNGGLWWVLAPSGKAITAAASGDSSGSDSYGSSSSGY